MPECNTCGAVLLAGTNWVASAQKKMHYICDVCRKAEHRAYYAANKGAINMKCKKWRRDNPDKVAENNKKTYDYYIRKTYGLTREQYDSLIIGANCAICGSTSNMCIDHCHTSGQIRGVLCRQCNSGIGLLGDDIKSVQKALDYLVGDIDYDITRNE